jgi:hypothetical protein
MACFTFQVRSFAMLLLAVVTNEMLSPGLQDPDEEL